MRRLTRLAALLFCMGLSALGVTAQTGTVSTFYSLASSSDGNTPYSGLVEASDGNFYGTTAQGGPASDGTIFRITPTGAFSVLYAFQGGAAGQDSQSTLIQGSDGNLYGTTSSGGANGNGMVFRVSLTGDFEALYSFTGGTDGAAPFAGLVEASDGNFYGTTSSGGAVNAAGFTGYGTIYRITPTGVLNTIYIFTGGDTDGAAPYAGLVEGSDGFLYGTGNNDEVGNTYYEEGNVFKVSKTGAFTNLYHFQGGNDGANPDGGLTEGSDGNFYGSTHNGGLFANDDDDTGQGVIFKVTPDGTFTTLYEFTGQAADSGRPEGTLALASDGNFYGTTTNSPQGTLFEITPAGKLTTLQLLGTNTEALDGPIVGSDGNLYGTTDNGGVNNAGSIFQGLVSPALEAPVQLTLSAATVALGNSATLNWKVVNAFSATMQRCFATVQNGLTGGGVWSGIQTGAATGGIYAGNAKLMPTASGSYVYALTCGGTVSGFATLTVPPMTLPRSSLPDGTVGAAYSATLSAVNGLAPFTWKLASGSLPAGLTLNASTGTISGTPTASGTSSFAIQVTDSESIPATVTSTISLTIATATPTVVLTATTLNIPKTGSSASTVVNVSGFTSDAFSFSCSGLPAKAACAFGSISGSQAYGTASLQITTDGSLSAKSSPGGRTAAPLLALVFPGLLAIAGLGRASRKFGKWRMLCVVGLLAIAGVAFSGCSSGSKTTYGTPTGTSTVTVTATAGDQSASTTLTLTVQ